MGAAGILNLVGLLRTVRTLGFSGESKLLELFEALEFSRIMILLGTTAGLLNLVGLLRTVRTQGFLRESKLLELFEALEFSRIMALLGRTTRESWD